MMSKKIKTRIRLSVLLLVLSLVGVIAGVFLIGFAERGTEVFKLPSKHWDCILYEVIRFIYYIAVPASFLGVMILSGSLVARCVTPGRPVVVQTLASVLIGAVSYSCHLLLGEERLLVFSLVFVVTTLLGAGVAWAERKAGWSFRRCSLLLLGMSALLYGSFTAEKWYMEARKERLTGRVFFVPPVSQQELDLFQTQLRSAPNREPFRSWGWHNELTFSPTTNAATVLKVVTGYEITKTGRNTFTAKKIAVEEIEAVVQPKPQLPKAD